MECFSVCVLMRAKSSRSFARGEPPFAILPGSEIQCAVVVPPLRMASCIRSWFPTYFAQLWKNLDIGEYSVLRFDTLREMAAQ